jgi:hypothetical protein
MEDTMTTLTPAAGITVTTYRGASDDVPVIQIDTELTAGRLRVNLNDGPPLYDGDPEHDDAPGAILTGDAPESAQQIADAVIAGGYVDAATFAFALERHPIDAHTVRALMANAARAALASLAPMVTEVRDCIDTFNDFATDDGDPEEVEAAGNLVNAAAWLANTVDTARS